MDLNFFNDLSKRKIVKKELCKVRPGSSPSFWSVFFYIGAQCQCHFIYILCTLKPYYGIVIVIEKKK